MSLLLGEYLKHSEGIVTPLTDEILIYKQTGANRDILIEKIAVDLYTYPKRKLGWDEDACSDFFCYFFPKISGMIDRFLYQGKPFEAFMFVTLKWQLKTYATRKSIEKRKRRLLINNEFWDNYNRGEYYAAEPDYNLTPRAKEFLNVSEDGLIRDFTSRRRILFLTMKGAFFIPDHLVEHISILTGYDREWLYNCLEKLRNQIKTRDSRLKILKIRRNKIFFKIYYIHEILSTEYEESKRSNLFQELLKEKIRLDKVLSCISRVPISPTHQDISNVLGIPKGSVDSGYYTLKNAILEPDKD